MSDRVTPETISENTQRILASLESCRVPLEFLELRVIDLPLKEHFKSAIGERTSRQALLVRWLDAGGEWGIAECSCRPDAYYSAEYLEGAALTIETQIAPLLGSSMNARELVNRLKRIRGWEFTRAAVLDAAFDYLRRRGEPGPLELWRSRPLERVQVGISLGLYQDPGALLERIQAGMEQGYRRIKLKIQPGMAAGFLARVRKHFPGLNLGLDANGSFDRESFPELIRLQEIQPAMLEQPFLPERLDLLVDLKQQAPRLRLCLDEGVHGIGQLRTAHRLKVIDELNLKPGRVGGELSALLLAEEAARIPLPVWIGGMFETGIGRVANLRVAARCLASAVNDLSPSSRYFAEELLVEPVRMDLPGEIIVPDAPPALRQDILEKFTCRVVRLRVPA